MIELLIWSFGTFGATLSGSLFAEYLLFNRDTDSYSVEHYKDKRLLTMGDSALIGVMMYMVWGLFTQGDYLLFTAQLAGVAIAYVVKVTYGDWFLNWITQGRNW